MAHLESGLVAEVYIRKRRIIIRNLFDSATRTTQLIRETNKVCWTAEFLCKNYSRSWSTAAAMRIVQLTKPVLRSRKPRTS